MESSSLWLLLWSGYPKAGNRSCPALKWSIWRFLNPPTKCPLFLTRLLHVTRVSDRGMTMSKIFRSPILSRMKSWPSWLTRHWFSVKVTSSLRNSLIFSAASGPTKRILSKSLEETVGNNWARKSWTSFSTKNEHQMSNLFLFDMTSNGDINCFLSLNTWIVQMPLLVRWSRRSTSQVNGEILAMKSSTETPLISKHRRKQDM